MADSLLVRPAADETGAAVSGGVHIVWSRYGNGPDTILFIPTWNFVDSRVLRRQVDGLRDRFRLITYDARGSGDSDHPSTGYRFDDHLADAIAVLDATSTSKGPCRRGVGGDPRRGPARLARSRPRPAARPDRAADGRPERGRA
jgi:hypothetical protein